MNQEKRWWNDKKYWNLVNEADLILDKNCCFEWPNVQKIVEEAMRRGKMEAFTEMKHEVRYEAQAFCFVGMPKDAVEGARRSGFTKGISDMVKGIEKRIDAKLSALSNSQEKV